VTDRDADALRRLASFLDEHGFEVLPAQDREAAFNILDARIVDCVIADVRAPRADGLALIRHAIERNAAVCAVATAEPYEVERGVEAMRGGACSVETRPHHLEKLLLVLQRGLAQQALAMQAAETAQRLDERLELDRLAGSSRAIHRVMDQVRSIASMRASVLIEGETGAGKGLVAQAIHRQSPRREAAFARIAIGVVAEPVVEGELFGVEAVPETGTQARPGLLEQADHGSVFLDGISEAPPGLQVRLLRYLRDRVFERAGGTTARKSDVRIIASTDRDLAGEVRAGRFRADLFDRLAAVRITMPPLRERREDIPLLVEAFIHEFNREHRRKVTGITRGVLDRMMRHDWPGNVRELKHTVEGMVAFAEGRRPLESADLPPALRGLERSATALTIAVGMTVAEVERQLIEATLAETGEDKPRAAAMLGIGLRTLYRKIDKYRRLR
jgi:DNA-binding NtrC family response regulator